MEYLLGLGSKKIDVVTLGLLTQLVEGEYHLEDDSGIIKLDLKKTLFHIGNIFYLKKSSLSGFLVYFWYFIIILEISHLSFLKFKFFR